jgi:hypothetical protein
MEPTKIRSQTDEPRLRDKHNNTRQMEDKNTFSLQGCSTAYIFATEVEWLDGRLRGIRAG